MLGDLPLWFPYLIVLLAGLCVGSFLNVCIARLPRGLSIVVPGSHCPECKTPIRWYDNIPLLSVMWLKGACRRCATKISWVYPLVEFLSAALALATFIKFPAVMPWAIWFLLFIAPLIVVTFIDLEHQIIPDVISLPGIVVGLAAQIVLLPKGTIGASLAHGGLGILVGGGFLFLVSYTYLKLRKREGLGGGDIKLAAMFGAFLGWEAILFILVVSSVLGSVVGLVVATIKRKGLTHAIPYGPFLVAAALLYLFFGHEILMWYLRLYHS